MSEPEPAILPFAARGPECTSARTPPSRLFLSPEEVAELTERVLDHSSLDRAEPGLPLETCLALFELQHVPEEVIRSGLDDLVRRREQRLSNVLRGKAEELERMFLGLLPRLDASFHRDVKTRIPEALCRGQNQWLLYEISAERGELEVRVRHLQGEGARQLFTLLARTARERSPWARLAGRILGKPRRVVVLDPAGLSLEDLLAASLGRAEVGLALEGLRAVVLGEIERALGFVRKLRFEGEAAPGAMEAKSAD